MMILKCISGGQSSGPDHRSQTGALVVGDPEVGEVLWYRGLPKKKHLTIALAKKEARMIGRLQSVQPFRKTKQVVLRESEPNTPRGTW